MAVSFISSSSIVSDFNNGGLTLTAPATIQNNDILVIVLNIEDNVTPTPPTGFTQWLNIDSPGSVDDLWIWWKRASSESGNYAITWTGDIWSEGFMMCTRGAETSGTPQDPAPTSNSGSGSTYTATGLTTTIDGDLIAYILGSYESMGAGVPPTGTTPTFTERYDSGDNIYVATGVMSPAGATGNKARTGGSVNWLATLVSIKSTSAAAKAKPIYQRKSYWWPSRRR